MAKNYIPNPDGDFDSWFAQFAGAFTNYATVLGFTAADQTAVNDALSDWQTAYTNHLTATNAARGARATKDNTRTSAESLIRGFVRRIQVNPNTTDQMRAEFGITIADTTRTPTPVPTTAPLLEADWSVRGQVTVHVGENPGNERFNKMGMNAKSALIQWRTNSGEWQLAGVTTSSPFVHTLENTEPITVEYRACYLNPVGDFGPWSETQLAYVSPVQVTLVQDQAA